jgi:hypothetical protein
MPKHVDTGAITVHGKVALVLLAAEHVVPLFAGRPETQELVGEVIGAGWSWIDRRTPDPATLYWAYNERLMLDEQRYQRDERLLAAFHGCLDMHYFTVREAKWVAGVEQPGVLHAVGEDVSEIDESYVEQCLAHVVQASPRPAATGAWLDGLVARIEREHPVRGGDAIGPKVLRASFDVAPIIE